MKRVALFFGSFNPIHNGHISIAKEVLNQGKADEVQFVLSPQNPLKSVSDLLPELHRWKMLQLALEDYKNLIPNNIELQFPKPSYTAATLKKLTQENPERDFCLLLGADSAATLTSWKNADFLLTFPRIVYPRKGIVVDKRTSEYLLKNVSLQDISATEIREQKNLKTFKEWLPKKVLNYIQKHRLINGI